MHLLALDTSTTPAALALLRADGARSASTTGPGSRHGRDLLPAIRDLLRAAGLSPRDLGAIAVGLGPGSYTGLRVGVTAAKTLAYATGARLFGLDSLDLFARSLPPRAGRVVVLSDAQRGDFHAAEFARELDDSPLLRVSPTRIASAAELAAGRDVPIVATGPGLSRWSLPWPRGVEAMPAAIDPDALLAMALEAVAAGTPCDPSGLEPVYLRRSAAEDQWTGKDRPPPQL